VADLRPRFTDDTDTHPGLRLTAVRRSSNVVVDADSHLLLSDGLGPYDMEIRWLAHLDDSEVLRIWRSWTGFQVYQALLEPQPADRWSIRELAVEQDPDRYQGSLTDEPARFDAVLVAIVNTLRYFRAGHTPYGPAADAGPAPSPWP